MIIFIKEMAVKTKTTTRQEPPMISAARSPRRFGFGIGGGNASKGGSGGSGGSGGGSGGGLPPVIGAPQFGQLAAEVLTSCPHSRHLVSAILGMVWRWGSS